MDEGRRMPGWVLPVVGITAVVALVFIGLNREPEQFDPDTPEGAVQSYLAALSAGDFDAAASYWAEDSCHPESSEPTGGTPNISAALVRVEGDGEEATVVIGITDNTNDPVNGIYESQEWFNMVREDGTWKILQPSWPYYDQMCEEPA